jgi:hypothetical protein
LVCGGSGTCEEVPKDLCTLNPTNTCWRYNTYESDAGDVNTGLPCNEVDQPMTGSSESYPYTYVIVCRDAIGVIYGFSQTFLTENNLSYNGTGYGDCIQLMLLYSGVEEGDYCDRSNVAYDLTDLINNCTSP